MLQKLSISNYAIIDELEISFSGRLNVITGETGAGKSIIMGALGLILGNRADTAALVRKEKKCVVEGIFQAGHKTAVAAFLRENELDEEETVVIRREISTSGKSRAFINDTPVNLVQLQALSSLLVDLHQQFDTQELGDTAFQRDVLDALAGHAPGLEEYRALYRQWKQVAQEAAGLISRKQQFDKEADYNRFQFQELEDAGFKTDELEQADAELKLLSHAEGIKAALCKTYSELRENETPVVQQLKTMVQQLQAFSQLHPDLPALVQRLQSAHIELQDIAADVDRISDQVNYDPARIGQLNERLTTGYKLQKKHGVNSTRELLEIKDSLEEKLQAVLQLDEIIQQKQQQAAALGLQVAERAKKITAGRKKQVKPLEEKVNGLLSRVGMPNARLRVSIEPATPGEDGADQVEFLFDANIPAGDAASGQFQPLRKVASGGERSRLMLCIKSLVAQSLDLPTLIFDEIDTGISGEAARQVGIIMKELAGSRQVICITHQPQIAGKADAHYFVYKDIVKNEVKTNIRLLSPEERITSIASMLSGEKPTAAALANAREMLMN